MKIDHGRPSEHGSFTIEATDGRTIKEVFRDLTTGLLIVREEEGEGRSRRRFITTVDPETGQIIPIEERKHHIDYAEQRVLDEGTKLELRSRRKIDATTGDETIDETLVTPDGVEVGRRERIAFFPSKLSTLLDDHEREEAEKAKAELFWTTEYAAMDFEARAAHWAGLMFRHMRWQSESGLDPYAGFNREWFDEAKTREPDFDRMFDYILRRYEQELLYEDTNPDAIRRRVGKP